MEHEMIFPAGFIHIFKGHNSAINQNLNLSCFNSQSGQKKICVFRVSLPTLFFFFIALKNAYPNIFMVILA